LHLQRAAFLEDTPIDPELGEARSDKTREIVRDPKREAGDRLIQAMREGIPFGGSPYPSREELHGRRDDAPGSR
jgi:hypothetical protein